MSIKIFSLAGSANDISDAADIFYPNIISLISSPSSKNQSCLKLNSVRATYKCKCKGKVNFRSVSHRLANSEMISLQYTPAVSSRLAHKYCRYFDDNLRNSGTTSRARNLSPIEKFRHRTKTKRKNNYFGFNFAGAK